ncbi:pleckstrin homology domain-containing family G member 4B isoform X2 [Patella vulgata]|uniref:pleckstrin homology domain-containing family G member 4B isoform X2 n=1 Tax=Patella vulgata TaxID=6465 RepID=UPI0024A80784|nr:pleckstrin homology domain-containing family G member 4B isoform X2 [Patella vulgata]
MALMTGIGLRNMTGPEEESEISDILCDQLVEYYGDQTPIVVKQVYQSLYKKLYDGDYYLFTQMCFEPYLKLLEKLKQISQEEHGERKKIPFCLQSAVLLHLCDLQFELQSQDFYYCVRLSESVEPNLVVKYHSINGVQEYLIMEGEYHHAFTTDIIKRIQTANESEIVVILRNCIVSVADGIERLKWNEVADDRSEDIKSTSACSQEKSISSDLARAKLNDSTSSCEIFEQSGNSETTIETKTGKKDGKLLERSKSSEFYTSRKLDQPQSVMDVDYDVLQSGIAVLPGCRDVNGGAVILMFTGSTFWHDRHVASTELARLLMYFYTIPRMEVREKELTIVGDIRGATSSIINILLESLYLFQDNIPECKSILHLVCDKVTQSSVLRSPVYDSKSPVKIDLLSSQDLIHRFIHPSQLPSALDGTFPFSHTEWVRFRMKLEPFLNSCREVAKFLVSIMQEISSVQKLPKTAQEASHLIEEHEERVKKAFTDSRLVALQNDGENTMCSLRREQSSSNHSEDYRYAMENVDCLFHQLQDTMMKLVHLADTRLNKIEQCLQLREFEEECSKVITWLTTEGNTTLQRHIARADNLKAIRLQQKDFEKFYFSCMQYIDKGNDLLEEASMLSQTGNFDEATGYKDLARMLKKHLHTFSNQLEDRREKIEGTAKCYQLLDKSYEWALEAMKYIASMKMEHCASPAGLDKLLKSLEAYLLEHPPLTSDIFDHMIEVTQRLQNDKLLDQCRLAKARCEETYHLLLLRQNTLQRARDQLTVDNKTKSDNSHSIDPDSVIEINSQSFWEPQMTSTPTRGITFIAKSKDQRRSCSPSTSSSSGSRDYTSTSSTSSNQMARQSKESGIVVSQDSCAGSDISMESLHQKLTMSTSMPQPGSTYTERDRPLKKLLKRTITSPVPITGSPILEDRVSSSSDPRSIRERRSGKSVSMVTGSSESLPSMPEDDDENKTSNGRVENVNHMRKEWTPVPVNSHLLRQNRNNPLSSMSESSLSQPEMKRRRTLSLIMSEMVQTERDYVQSLEYVIDNYIPELQREDVPQALRGKRNVIFGNIEKIYDFHCQYFLHEVESCEFTPYQIGQYILSHENAFYLYALYNKNKPKSDLLMAEFGKTFFMDKQLQLNDKMNLASYLLKPVQRMGKYALLLKQIIRECSETEPEYQELKAAEEMVKFQLRHGNDLLAMDALKDSDVNLQEQGRLLRQDEFLVWQGRKKSIRRVFLFEDLILFSKTKRGRQGHHDMYLYKNSFKSTDLGLTENYDESGFKFEIWFRKRNSGDKYILQAQNTEVKRAWVNEISKLLWKQAMRNREVRLSEMATMGMGNKPCLDLKQSADNIQDRYINVGLGLRGSRCRNSIAVSSFDHLRNGNKRPHSIISVSSNSSSNSSHSSFGLFGSLNLAFDPLDTLRHQHRTSTLLSNESGVGTDMSSGCAEPSGDLDKSNRCVIPNDQPVTSSARSYINYMKSKVLKKSREPVVTDV